MKRLSRLTALLLAMVLLLTSFAFAEGVKEEDLDAATWNEWTAAASEDDPWGLGGECGEENVYCQYVNALVNDYTTAQDRYDYMMELANDPDDVVALEFTMLHYFFNMDAHTAENVVCICNYPSFEPEYVPGDVSLHEEDCPWHFANLSLAEQYELVEAADEETAAEYTAALDEEAQATLARVNVADYTATDGSTSVTINVPEDAFNADYLLNANCTVVDSAIQSALLESGESNEIVAAYDISFQNIEDGTEIQPVNGVPVDLTFDVPENGMYAIYHMIEDGKGGYVAEIVGFDNVVDGSISVDADAFSIYTVTSIGNTSGTRLTGNESYTYNAVIGGNTVIFYVDETSNGEWRVEDTAGVISYVVSDNGSTSGNNHRARWIAVTPKNEGTAILTYVSSSGVEATVTYVVSVPEGFYVDDQVAENGCLAPAGLDITDGTAITYNWTRSDGQEIRESALTEDGKVNISLDRGGVTNARDPITYTVEAITADGTSVASASYEVMYGNEILNASFESPVVGDGAYIYNGHPGLYWKTTAPGTGTAITQDIEILTEENSSSLAQYFGVNIAADGKQFVELNAERIGTLYQDILTTSGSTLTWQFSHAARTTPSDSNNKMFVVIGATKDAQDIIDASDITSLLRGLDVDDMPTSGEGYKLVSGDEVFYVWGHDAAKNANGTVWENISGTYVVPEGQYLTRIFFASDPNSSSSTCGNLIDATSAGEHYRYKVEYYIADNVDSTEAGNGTVYTYVELQNLQDYISDGYVVTGVTVNGNSYSGNYSTDGLYITEYEDAEGYERDDDEEGVIIMEIRLSKKAITITKNVEIIGWDDLSVAEREAIMSDYSATFGLYKSGTKVGEATAHISYTEGQKLTALVEIKPTSGDLEYTTYTIKEEETSSITGFELESTTFNQTSVTLSSRAPTAAVICTNTYKAQPVTINYVAVTSAGGNLSLDTETVSVFGEVEGSIATANAGYEFKGWYKEEACSTLLSTEAEYKPEKVNGLHVEATYYAKFTENQVTINYKVADDVGGTVAPANETLGAATGVAKGSTATAAAGYTFAGWYSDEACTKPVGDAVTFVPAKVDGLNVAATYYAKFTENQVTINYKVAGNVGGTVNPESETLGAATGVAKGSTATAAAGYTFAGWYSDEACNTPVGSNAEFVPTKEDTELWEDGTTYYAKFTENEATITYVVVSPDTTVTADECGTVDLNDGDKTGALTSTNETIGVVTGDPVGATAAPVSNVYKFVGWYDNAECEGEPISPNASFDPIMAEGATQWTDATYYAKFDYNQTTLTITKSGADLNLDANQTFIFKVTGGDLGANGITVCVTGNDSVTISGLTVGVEYTVTEQNGWSWRYTASPESITLNADASKNNVTVSNSRIKKFWLDGNAPAVTNER